MSGGKPGTNPKGGIIGKGGAFGGVGAFAGAGAAAAFSFLTLEAGFLGMVPWARWRRCPWVGRRECRFDARLQSCLVRKGSAARRREKRGDARWATSWRCAQTRVGARGCSGLPFELVWPRPKLAGIHCFRLVGNLFLREDGVSWAGGPRAGGSGALGTAAVELWSIAEPR